VKQSFVIPAQAGIRVSENEPQAKFERSFCEVSQTQAKTRTRIRTGGEAAERIGL
jgi:hypothetical protein